MEDKIYLNSAAGCKVYPKVIETMNDVLLNHWGNASAETSDGVDARQIINDVSTQIMNDINCNDISEIVYTSCACESNSLAIKGYINANLCGGLITSKLEHTSIDEICNHLNNRQISVLYVVNGTSGNIMLSDLQNKCKQIHNPLVSISYANSEIGTIQDIKKISEIVHEYNGILHVDATQYFPWHKVDVKELEIDMMTVSGQKFHAPRGIGFLYVRNGIKIDPQINGSQQNGMRSGTMPTHLIAAMGKALSIIRKQSISNVSDKRNYLLNKLLEIEEVSLNGPSTSKNRLPNNISVSIHGVNAEMLVTMCDLLGIVIARSSACKSYNPKPSKTLLNIGLSEEKALSTVRITIDDTTTMEDIEQSVKVISHLIERIREENA